MAFLSFADVGIKAVSACVPQNTEYTRSLSYMFTAEQIRNFESTTGIVSRHIAGKDTCTSDLCCAAAKRLLQENSIAPDSIDMILFMSQTPDYAIPATAPIIQHRLGIPQSAACMDLNLACSGYVYALSTAFAYASSHGINRVLLLAGDTISKVLNKKDKGAYPVFGDAGTATLIEKGAYGKSCFSLNTAGGGV